MTRLWREGQPIAVSLDAQGQPHSFLWQDRVHGVERIVQSWRVDVEWWRWRVWRDYYKLCTRSGLMVIICCDLTTEQWYLHRLYD